MPLILHLHSLHCTSFHRHLRLYASNPKKPNRFNRTEPPARDRVIDFGKHKGCMLGSLPSSYIRWLSRTLRARDFEHWARLADEVLADPVYADRVEWESAQRVLGGDGGGASPAWRCDSPAKEFAELCERFSWDVQDRHGWARLDFDLLGTSHSGRIPRISAVAAEDVGKTRSYDVGNDGKEEVGRGRSVRETRYLILGNEKNSGNFGGNSKRIITKETVTKENREGNVKETLSLKEIGVLSNRDFGNAVKESEGRVLSNGCRFLVEEEEEVGVSAREKRRERRTLKREQQMEVFRKNVGKKEEKQERADDRSSSISQRSLGNKEVRNPFPGRSPLLDKINKRRQGD